MKNNTKLCEIWGYHNSEDDDNVLGLVPCNFVGRYQHIEETYCFNPEDGESMFRWNVNIYLQNYMVPKPKHDHYHHHKKLFSSDTITAFSTDTFQKPNLMCEINLYKLHTLQNDCMYQV